MSKRLGLIVGINNYQDTQLPPLQFAENDARALAQWLVNVKGGKWSPADVQHVQGIHATHELIESLISQVCLTIAGPDDLVYIYFAGHSFVDERGDGYLACTNTQVQNAATAIHLPSLANIMARSRAAHILLLLDCTQIGSVWDYYRASPYDFKPLLSSTLSALPPQQMNRLFLCSCRANNQAMESGVRGLGLFMYQYILGMCGPAIETTTATAPLRQLHFYLSQALPEQQKPHLFGQEHYPLLLTGDFPDTSLAPPYTQQEPSSDFATAVYQQGGSTATATAQPYTQQQTSGFASTVTDQYRQQQIAAWLANAQHLVQQQQFVEAISIIEQILQVQPNDLATLTLKGQLLGTMGRFPEALTVVQQLTQLDPRNALVWSMRAVLLTNMGEFLPALESIEHAITLDGNNAENYAIKNNIMAYLPATPPPTGKPLLSDSTPVKQRGGPRSFFISLAIQIAGLVLGIVGSVLLTFVHSSALPGLGLQSIGLALLCVNAARGTYRYGISRLLLTLFTSLLAAAVLGAAFKPFLPRLLTVINDHATLFMPLLFVAFWLVLIAALPLLIALGGLLAGLFKPKK